MRDIKFRCWHRGYEGDRYDEVEPSMLYDSNPGDCLKWMNERQPIQVMQYIGLKDKNGVEIYEGDIVKQTKFIGGNFIEYHTEVFEVIWMSTGFTYKPLKNKSVSQYTISPFSEDIKVIGNIYQHVELLLL